MKTKTSLLIFGPCKTEVQGRNRPWIACHCAQLTRFNLSFVGQAVIQPIEVYEWSTSNCASPRNNKVDKNMSDYNWFDDIPATGAPHERSTKRRPSRRGGSILSAVLLAAQGLLSVVIVAFAYLGQVQFVGCGYIGSDRVCNYALGTISLYALTFLAVLLFLLAIFFCFFAHRRNQRSWPIPIMGLATVCLAYVVHQAVMYSATH